MCKKTPRFNWLRCHTDRQHLVFVAGLFVLSILSAFFLPFVMASVLAIIIVDAYLCVAVFEMAVRSRLQTKDPQILTLPDREICLIISIACLVLLTVLYADLYIWSEEVANDADLLSGWVEAIYFSAVTITTLGFGEFTPVGPIAQLTVVSQLFSGVVVFAAAFSAVVSRSVG